MPSVRCLKCGWGDSERPEKVSESNAPLYAASFIALMKAHSELTGHRMYEFNSQQLNVHQWWLTRIMVDLLVDEVSS